jgi:16S rRNA (guanine966-N2)-methyltransferase
MAENLNACGIESRAKIFRWDVHRGLSCVREHRPPFTLVFLDPPYERDLLKTSLVRLRETGSLAPRARIVVEHSKDEPLPDALAGLTLQDRRRYGKTLVSFYEYGM